KRFPSLCMSRNINSVPSLFFQPGNSPLTSTPVSRDAWAWFSRTVVAIVLLFASTSAYSQDTPPRNASGQAGSIRGIVSTMQDNALSGVAGISVKLSADPLRSTPLSADTDEHGGFEFKNLEP